MSVDIANNGEESLHRLNEQSYDIVLMDIQMPVMDGIEATRLIRQNSKFARLPVLAVSASVTEEVQRHCAAAGTSGFIEKPVDTVELISKLLELCTNSKVELTKPVPAMNKDICLEGFDSSRLAEVAEMMGSTELLMEVIDSMRVDFSPVISEITAHITQGNLKAAKDLAHKVKGASASVGAIDIHTAARALENKLLLGEMATDEVENLKQALGVFLDNK